MAIEERYIVVCDARLSEDCLVVADNTFATRESAIKSAAESFWSRTEDGDYVCPWCRGEEEPYA